MNQKQCNKNSPAAQGDHCTNQQLPDFEEDVDLLDLFQPILLALNLYIRTGELTAPLTHIPQVVYHEEGRMTILVRYLCQGKQENFFVGPPLTPQRMEAANKEWIDTDTTELEGN